MKSTRWGLIGAGWIATRTIAPAMHAADDTIVQAVASRDTERAQALNPITVHQSYEDLINDPNFNINDYEGYIYMTSFLDLDRKYIGKKNFFHTTNVKLGKKELANLPVARGKKPTKKKVVKESDWKTYYGSSDEVKQWAKTTPTDKLTRVVLCLCKSSKELTYYETKYLFDYNVLADDKVWVNSNILGKFFPKDLASQE